MRLNETVGQVQSSIVNVQHTGTKPTRQYMAARQWPTDTKPPVVLISFIGRFKWRLMAHSAVKSYREAYWQSAQQYMGSGDFGSMGVGAIGRQ